ncbi:hypothetical protein EMCRGX_G018655 [Ephydatia muelleri]
MQRPIRRAQRVDEAHLPGSRHGLLVLWGVLEVPPGAVPCDQPVTLRIGVSLYGPFPLPNGRRSISPVVFLSTSSPVKLLKPARLTVPHFLDVARMTAAEMGVVCLKAPREVTNGSVAFDKEEIEMCLSEQCGVVQLDHLATYVCLTRPDPSPMADRELVCLYCIEDCKTQKIILPVTYSLPTCRKHLEEQFGGLKVSLIGTFKLGASGVITINHERQQDGWLFPLKKGRLISKDDIDFQKCHEGLEALKQNERERLYPPNFLIGAVRISADAKPTVLRIEVYVVGGSVRFSIDVAVPLMQGKAGDGQHSN